MARFCTECGNRIEDGVAFCTACGTKAPIDNVADTVTVQAEATITQKVETQPVQTPPPVQAAQPVQTPPPVQAAQPVQTPPPVQAAQPVQTPPPVQSAQPVQAAAPIYHQQQQAYQSTASEEDATRKVVGTGAYFGLMFLFGIPLIGLIACIIMAFAPKNRNIKNYARAMLIWTIIGLVLTGVLVALFVAFADKLADYLSQMIYS